MRKGLPVFIACALLAACGSAAAARPPASTISSPSNSSPPSSTLPMCPTESATGCDRSKVAPSPCQDRGPREMTASPIDLDQLAWIVPMGTMAGGHVTPIDHGYFYVKGALANPAYPVPVKSPLDGIITAASRTVRQNSHGPYDDYAVTIAATCTFRVRFSNMVRFDAAFGAQVGALAPGQQVTPNYRVRAGELIGETGLPTAYGIDVWVENDESTLTGFIHPDQYTQAEAWKTHVVDMFDYMRDPLKAELLAFDLRDAPPPWGKIDYDVDGRLVGNWFRVGTGGYGGLQSHLSEGYWEGHLAVVYDGIDPTAVEVSFGDFAGQARQFVVVGNSPDPATVSQASGAVEYELAEIAFYSATTGVRWDTKAYAPHLRAHTFGPIAGTVLMQLIGPRQLKVEIFPGKPRSAVGGFDANALVFER